MLRRLILCSSFSLLLSGACVQSDSKKELPPKIENSTARVEASDTLIRPSLNNSYDSGETVPDDVPEGIKWNLKKVARDDPEGAFNLGGIYTLGLFDVPRNNEIAFKWYLEAAEQDFTEAQYNVGLMYKSGRGVSRDYTKAAEWFRRAAQQGFPQAQNAMGFLYYKGDGVSQNDIAAYQWFHLSAAQGNLSAKNRLKQVSLRMEPDQIEEAERRSKVCFAKNYTECD